MNQIIEQISRIGIVPVIAIDEKRRWQFPWPGRWWQAACLPPR